MNDQQKLERLLSAILGIAMMDVYTRPGELPAHDVMRQIATDALRDIGMPNAADFAESSAAEDSGG